MEQNKLVLSTLILLSLWISLSGHTFAQDKPDSLEFRIAMEKDTFFLAEPIWLDLYMANLSGEKVGIKPLTTASDWLKIIIVDSKNDTIPYKGEVSNWIGGGPTFTVEPKETLYICRDLLMGTGFGILEGGMSGRSYLKPDTYKIKAVYKRYLESNQFTFTVVNPTGSEKTALQLWREGYRNQTKEKVDISIEKWKGLIKRYPKSVYAPSACWALIATFEVFKSDLKNSELYEKKLLSDYPNSGHCQHAFGSFIKNKSEEEKDQKLKELEKKYAGTRAGEFAKNIRKKIYAY